MNALIRLAKNVIFSNLSDLQFPYKLTYALTYRCQLHCSMCNIWTKDSADELTLEEIKDFFRRSNRFSWINLSGGELFLRPDLLDIVRAVDKHCQHLYLLNFPTNGYQTDIIVETIKDMLRSCSFPRLLVTVSLDGPPGLHDRIRNTPGSWDNAVDTYQRLSSLKSSRFGVYFGLTLQKANAEAFEDTVRSVQERISDVRPADFHVNVVHSSSHYYGNANRDIQPDRTVLLSQLDRIRKLRGYPLLDPVHYLERKYQAMACSYITQGMTPVPCQALSASLFLDPRGTVYPCSAFDKPVGNIREFGYSLDRLWQTDRKRQLRKEVLEKKCPQCWTPCEAYQSIMADMVPWRKR